MRASSSKMMMVLNFYSVFRHLGQSPQEALEAMSKGSDLIESAKNQLALMSGKSEEGTAKNVAKAQQVIGIVDTVVSKIPVVGTIASYVCTGVNFVLGVLTKIFNVPADKYDFYKPKSYYKRACIGLTPPPGSVKLDRGNFYYMTYKGTLAMYLHDGYMYPPPSLTDPALMTGRVQGVVAKGWKRGADSWKKYRKLWGPPGLSDAQWNDRAYNVGRMFAWIQKKFPDKQLKVIDDVLTAEEDKSSGDARKRGSVWYASIVYLANDLFDACKAIGWTAAAQKIRTIGKADKAAAVVAGFATNPSKDNYANRGIDIVAENITLDGCILLLSQLSKGLPKTAFRVFATPVVPAQSQAQKTEAIRSTVKAWRSAPVAPAPAPRPAPAPAVVPAAAPSQAIQPVPTAAPAAPVTATVPTGAITPAPMSNEKKLLIAGGAVAGVGLLALVLKAKR